MSAPAIALPSSAKKGTETQPTILAPQEDVAIVAYVLWQQRGCPEGSPEVDWIEAEEIVRNRHASALVKAR